MPSELSGVYAVALEEYVEALAAAPLAQQTRRTYAWQAATQALFVG